MNCCTVYDRAMQETGAFLVRGASGFVFACLLVLRGVAQRIRKARESGPWRCRAAQKYQ